RNIERDTDGATGGRKDRGVHPNDFTLEVEGRPAGVAAVDRRVDLQKVVIRSGADITAPRRDDACRHRTAKAEGIAHRDDPVADPGRLRGKLYVWEIVTAFDLQKR